MASFSVPFTVHFPRLTSDQWDDIREPLSDRAARNRHDPRFIATLELLTFIAQRDLRSLTAHGALGAFVDALRAQIDSVGAFTGVSIYPLMLSRKQSPGLKEHVELAVLQVEQSLDRIRREAEDAFNQKAGV